MKTLTKAEALALQKNGSRFLSNGKEMGARDLLRIPTPLKKVSLLARFCDTLAEGFTRLSEAQNRTAHAISQQKPQAPPEILVTPEAPDPVKWHFEITRDKTGKISHMTATPDTDTP